MKKLLWYNPRYAYNLLKDYNGVSHWKDIYNVIMPFTIVDRSEIIKTPLYTCIDKYYSNYPDLYKEVLNFDNCCLKSAEEIYKKALVLDKPIYALFSGGIDSTAMLVAFLKIIPSYMQRDYLKVVTTIDGYIEYKDFFEKNIFGKLEIINTFNTTYMHDTRAVIVNGEPGSTLNLTFSLVAPSNKLIGSENLTDKLSVNFIYNYLLNSSKNFSEKSAKIWSEILYESSQKFVININSIQEFFWWLYFNLSWQNCCIRQVIVRPPSQKMIKENVHTYIHPFYYSEDFQRYAILKDDKYSYRRDSFRKFIFDYTKDENYLYNKSKCYSYPNISRLKSLQGVGITEDYEVIYDPKELINYYDIHNTFTSLV